MRPTATVIIPTFGEAGFARWAIRSVQDQTVRDIEICIICDGSPQSMVASFESMARQDHRIRVFTFPKAPRTGEPHRDVVIGQTRGRIVCYCSHDDLWLPFHVHEIERTLRRRPFAASVSFTHTIHAALNVPEQIAGGSGMFHVIHEVDLADPHARVTMLSGTNFFGLTFGAHTRKAYYGLPERWVTTPEQGTFTDLYMWCKFLSAYPERCRTTPRITALSLPQPSRIGWSEQQRDEELSEYYQRIQDPGSLREIEAAAASYLQARASTEA